MPTKKKSERQPVRELPVTDVGKAGPTQLSSGHSGSMAMPVEGEVGAKGAGVIAGSAKNFSVGDRAFGQLNDPRMGQLAAKLNADALQNLASNPSATRFMDASTGHINVIQEVEGKLILIMLPREAR